MRESRGEYRLVYRALVLSRDYKRLPARARLLLLTLKLRMPDCGIDTVSLDEYSDLTGMPQQMVRSAIQDLVELGWAKYDEPILWIINGLRYSPAVRNASARIGIQKHIASLTRSYVVTEFARHYGLEPPRVGRVEYVGTQLAEGDLDTLDSAPFEAPPETQTTDASVAPVDAVEVAPEAPVKPPKKKTIKFDDDDMALAQMLLERINIITPGYSESARINLDEWANDIRIIRALDKRSIEELRFIFSNFDTLPFLRRNLRSPNFVRGRYSDGRDKWMAIMEDLTRSNGRGNGTDKNGRGPRDYFPTIADAERLARATGVL